MFMRALAIFALFAVGCGDDASRPTDTTSDIAETVDAPDTIDTADTPDTADTLEDIADTADAEDASDAADTGDTTDADAPVDVDDYGFHIRVPQVRSVPSEDFEGTIRVVDQMDIDHVCRLTVDGVETFLYVQADPIRCRDFGGCEYRVTGAFTTRASGPVNAPLAGVSYDFGGNHHNDWITLPATEGTLKIYHSSFGFGWRACHPPDCVQVLAGDTVIEDGCTPERTRPAVCVLIGADGSEPPLVDDFAPCAGDPNHR